VLVAPGTYTGAGNRDLDFGGVNLTLLGEQGAGNTIIDCEGLARGLNFHSGEDTTAVVQGFTIQHAAADSGAGAMCSNYSTPRFLHCTFRLNAATERGGGVGCRNSASVFRNCTFEQNEVAGSTFPYGGAMALFPSSAVTVEGCEFNGNTAAGMGGAVWFLDSDAEFRRCAFSGNTSGGWGGGVSATWSAPLFSECVFSANHGSDGGAIYTQNADITALGCRFEGNSTTGIGNAIWLQSSYATLNMISCVLSGNTGGTGVLAVTQGAAATVTNCTFVSNFCVNGGMIYANQSSPLVQRSVIAFASQGKAAVCATGTENPVFYRDVVFGNVSGDELCGAVTDTLHRDPRFCDMAYGYYYLCDNSICSQYVNPWSELIGALDVDCGACGSPVEATTWGAIKALYR
jgi:predicted outer membrane repeat protein